MRRAIIHIGMPRTGSTAFQQVMAGLRSELHEAGILYPDLTPKSALHDKHISHQYFGETLDSRRPRREREELLQALSGALSRYEGDTVLLSYEDLIQQQQRFRVPEILNRFFEKHGFAAEALVVVKPQSEHLNSLYTHRTQMMREFQSFAHFAPAYAGSVRFEYDTLIQPWMTAFSGRVRAVPVRDRRIDAPIVLRLLSELDLASRVVPLLRHDDLDRVANRSPGPVAVEISRRMRAMRIHAQLRVLPRQMMRFVERQTGQHGFDREKFYGVGPELRAGVEMRYRDVNERFARTVWAKGWDDIVAPDPVRPVNELAVRRIDPATEHAIDTIMWRAARRFEVTPRHSIFDLPINRLVANVDAVQRRLGYSRWRVL
jgi:hypothetical protein